MLDDTPNWANAPEADNAVPSRKKARAASSQARRVRKTTASDARDRDRTSNPPTHANVLNPRLIVPRPGPQGGRKNSSGPNRSSAAPRAAPLTITPAPPKARTVEKQTAGITDLGKTSPPFASADIRDRHGQAKQSMDQLDRDHQSPSHHQKPTSALELSQSMNSRYSAAPLNQTDSEPQFFHGDLHLATVPRPADPHRTGGSREGAPHRKLQDFMVQSGPRPFNQHLQTSPRQPAVLGTRSVPATASNSIPVSPLRNRYTIAAARAPASAPHLSPEPPGQSLMNGMSSYSEEPPENRRHPVLQQREPGEMHVNLQALRQQEDQRRLEWEYARKRSHSQHPQELGIEGSRTVQDRESGTNPSWTMIAEQLARMSFETPRSEPRGNPTEGANWNIFPEQPWQPYDHHTYAHVHEYASQEQPPNLDYSSFPQQYTFAPRSASESVPRSPLMHGSNAPHTHNNVVNARSSPYSQGVPSRGPQIRPLRDRAQTGVPKRKVVPDYKDPALHESTRSPRLDATSDNRYREENWRSFDS